MQLDQLTNHIVKLDTTMSSGNLTQITKDFTSLANINCTAEMVAEARKKLHLEQLSTQNYEAMAKIFQERLKLLNQRIKILADCTKSGFKSIEERTQTIVGVAMAFNEFKKVMTQMGFGLDSHAQQSNNFMATYRR